MEKRKCAIRVAKTKALISVLVSAYADCWFSHEAAQYKSNVCRDQLLIQSEPTKPILMCKYPCNKVLKEVINEDEAVH